MWLLDLFKRKKEKPSSLEHPKEEKVLKRGVAVSEQIEITSENISSIQKCFFAFDVETTGLNPAVDRIIEIGVVLFSNGKEQKIFSTLVNPGILVPQAATDINHITNSMLSNAPSEKEVYPKLIEFLNDALHGKSIMCAHNAKFDLRFLCHTFSRLGINAEIKYVDTLSLSRRCFPTLKNHKQSSIEEYLDLDSSSSHRAGADAKNCGYILLKMLPIANEILEAQKRLIEQSRPSPFELEVCAFIQEIISQNGGDTHLLRYNKNSQGYIEVICLYIFLKFKFGRKGNYILVERDCSNIEEYITEPCTQSEGGANFIRVYFSSPYDLEALSEYIYNAFQKCHKSMKEDTSCGDRRIKNFENNLTLTQLSSEEVSSMLINAKEHSYALPKKAGVTTRQLSRNEIIINAIHSRVPLSEIQNIDNWEQGFEKGYPYWEKGENERKKGNLTQAIKFFDKARQNGYVAPALYNSYAITYRQLKDYSNEIVILDEGIARIPEKSSGWCARREKAFSLLLLQQEREERKVETMPKNENYLQKEDDASVMDKPHGRAVLQLNSEGHIVREYDTIAAAAQEIGIHPKGIRDVANGHQKTAGGYRWIFKDTRK